MKKVSILLFLMVLILSITNISFASETLVNKSWEIVDAVLWVGYVIALGMVVFIGIKYITGAADSKANMKSALVGYCIGAVLVFSATTIVKMVISWTGGSSETSGAGFANGVINSILSGDTSDDD